MDEINWNDLANKASSQTEKDLQKDFESLTKLNIKDIDALLKQSAISKQNAALVLEEIKELGKIPVVNFAAGGIATPADAALMMQLGCDGVFVGSGIFKSGDPAERAEAIVVATTNYNDPKVLADVSKDLGEPMVGINIDTLTEEEKLAKRGW